MYHSNSLLKISKSSVFEMRPSSDLFTFLIMKSTSTWVGNFLSGTSTFIAAKIETYTPFESNLLLVLFSENIWRTPLKHSIIVASLSLSDFSIQRRIPLVCGHFAQIFYVVEEYLSFCLKFLKIQPFCR